MVAFGKAAAAGLAGGNLWAFPGDGPGQSWSPLGTPHFPHLPSFLEDNPLPHGRPWGTRTSNDTNYYQETPNTGVTRHYDWTISRESCNPDGYENTCLLVNGQFPGPVIEANWGDWIEVKVTNNIPDEGTAIHWHGLLQKNTPYMDGTPGISQCPIAPGATFTYRFQADLYGTSWWHSHWSAQYGSGLYGPIVIYGPKNDEYDADLGPVMVSDYYHMYYTEAVEEILRPVQANPGPPFAANILINGHPSSGGSGMASFNFTSGKTYRIRVINPSSAAVVKFSIDNHMMKVIANDFVEIEPYETDHITLAVGQRSDVLVKATGQPTDSAWMRGFQPPPCSPIQGETSVTAAIFYEDADRSQVPTSQPQPGAFDTYCGNDPLSQTVPTYPIDPGEPSVTEIIPLEFKPNASGNLLWYMANRTFRIDYNDPILLESKLGDLDFPEIRNVHNYGSNASVRFVIENTGVQPHPMHLHGHNIFVLAEGPCGSQMNQTVFGNSRGTSEEGHMPPYKGKRELEVDYGTRKNKRDDSNNYGTCWDGTITNPSNPQRRDVQMLLPGHYIVVQWNQDNPGAWPMHCHIAWHLSAGFVWMVLENPGAIEKEMQIPSVMAQTCRDWSAWTGDHVVDQIDDGL